MTDEKLPVDDWQGYEAARLRSDEIHGEYLRTYSQRSYEYGVLAVKNFMLISGGALIALPALAKLSAEYDGKMAIMAGICFAFSLLVSLVCTYVIHLNWTLLYESEELAHAQDLQSLSKAYLPSRHDNTDEERDYQREIDAKTSKIWWTWAIPHVLGVIGFAIFLLGCWFFYSGFSVLGAKV